MRTRTVVVGSGGHGREVLDVVEACNAVGGSPAYELMGVLDDSPSEPNLALLRDRGVKFLGSVDEWLAGAEFDVEYLIGIGSEAARRSVDARLSAAGLQAGVAVHPASVRGYGVELAPGCVVLAGAVLATNISLGRHTHLHRCATVGHDCVIGDFVTINPSATVSGDCVVEDDVMIGAGAVILQGLTVHRGAAVGGQACVVQDVPAGVTAKGVPAHR